MEDENLVEDVQSVEDGEEKDWQAEAQKLSGQVANLNKALHETRSKKSSGTDVETIIERKLQDMEKARRQDDIEEIALSIAPSEDERTKLLDVYAKRIQPSGFSKTALKRDLEEAYMLANREKFVAEAEKRARKTYAEGESMRSANISAKREETDEEETESYSEAEKKLLDALRSQVKK